VFLGTYDEFLSKVGWEEEDPSQNDSGRTAPKKESAHARAELIKERSKILNPLKKKMEALETEIQKQEIIIKKNNDQILELAQSGNNQAIGPISVESKRCQDKVNQLYHELELLMLEIDQVEEKYQL
jgi:ATP-binding cassette subfamily F protein 3